MVEAIDMASEFDTLPVVPLPPEFSGIDVFIVGGFVRDHVHGVEEPSDVDLMVTGVEPNELRDRNGFTAVENETFPVFFDRLGREVALAREEQSDGDGHSDFEVLAVPSTVDRLSALERDLVRRDLTINAMALDPRTGELFDPHNGHSDLQAGIIRHVSEHFTEDPLRVLRAARFAARLDFVVASKTAVLMRNVAPQISELPEERLRMELTKNFKEAKKPSMFFKVLASVDALDVSFPHISNMREVPAGPPQHHSEGSVFNHTMAVIRTMHDIRGNDLYGLLAALAHDFGKLETPENQWPAHHGHGKAGISVTETFANRLSMSNQQRRVMHDACRHHMKLHNVENLNEATVFDLVAELHIEPDLLVDLGAADAFGRTPTGDFPEDLARKRLNRAVQAIEDVNGQDLIEAGRDPQEIGGETFGKLLRDKRIERMHKIAGDVTRR